MRASVDVGFPQQAASGPGLCFIAFTDAINQMPGSTFWSLLFFLMLLALGLDSLFGALESVTTALQDVRGFKRLRKEVLSGKAGVNASLTLRCVTVVITSVTMTRLIVAITTVMMMKMMMTTMMIMTKMLMMMLMMMVMIMVMIMLMVMMMTTTTMMTMMRMMTKMILMMMTMMMVVVVVIAVMPICRWWWQRRRWWWWWFW